MPSPARLFDWALALSVWSWAVLGPLQAPADDRWVPVRLCISALHLLVGWLVIRRLPLRQLGSKAQLLAAAPAVAISGLALASSGPLHAWPALAQGLFVVGTATVLIALGTLGANFAILPALRGVTTSGPYGFVRHPAYLGELLMVAACALVAPLAWSGLLALTIPLVVLRIGAEESLLSLDPAWRAYRQRVPYRLVPGVW